MMLFKPIHVPLIQKDIKTETRRLWKPEHAKRMISSMKKGTILKCKLKLFTQEYFAKIKILDIRKQAMIFMTEESCRKEGYPDLSYYQFWKMFCDLHGLGCTDSRRTDILYHGKCDDRELYVVEFERVE